MLCQFVIVCLFVDTSLHVCVCCLSASVWVCLTVGLCLTIYLSVCACLSFCVSVHLFVRPSGFLSVCLFVPLFVCGVTLWPRDPMARLDTGLKPCSCQRKTHSTSQETKSDNIRSVGICMYTPCAPSNLYKCR